MGKSRPQRLSRLGVWRTAVEVHYVRRGGSPRWPAALASAGVLAVLGGRSGGEPGRREGRPG
jgi:hypothetical protein